MNSPLDHLNRQITRVKRRLFIQTLVKSLIACWVLALLLAGAWLLVFPPPLPEAVAQRWLILGSLVGVATLLAFVLTYLRRPSPIEASLYLDERFGLKERITTCLSLDEQQRASPAGIALIEDATRCVERLHVGERFPVRLPWSASLVPLGAILVTLIVLFHDLKPGQARVDDKAPLSDDPAVLTEIEQQKKQLLAKSAPRPLMQRPPSPELQQLRERSDKLAKTPTNTREEARDAIKEITSLEDEMKKREQELAERADAMKEQMKQVERLSKKDENDRLRKKKKGPAERFDQAMSDGDLEEARQEALRLSRKLDPDEQKQNEEKADRLRKKLKDPELKEEERERLQRELEETEKLTEEQRKQLEEQLKDMQEKLKRLTRKEETEKKLKEMEKKGEITKEELERELEELKKNQDKLDREAAEGLEEVEKKLGECEQCMKDGKDGEASRKLQEAADKLGQMDPRGEQAELRRQIQLLQQTRRTICRALEGQPATGKRPQGKEHETKHLETKARGEVDDKGRLDIIDFVPGEGFKGPFKPTERFDDIKKAVQQASEAVDRQRLPRSASSMTRDYFDRIRESEKKK